MWSLLSLTERKEGDTTQSYLVLHYMGGNALYLVQIFKEVVCEEQTRLFRVYENLEQVHKRAI